MFGLRFAPFVCLAVLISIVTPSTLADAAMATSTTNEASEMKRAQSILATNDAAMDPIMADNNIRISNSKIVLAAQDKKAMLKAIADAVLAQQVGLAMASDNDDDQSTASTMMKNKKTNKAARGTPITVVTFPVSRDAFLYYAPDPRDASQNVVRLGWRYALADWKLYRALIAPSACEVKRTVGDYYYC